MSENNYTVYKHTTPSGKVYIGITKQKVEKRWLCGHGYLNKNKNGEYSQKAFANAINKYGWNNIKHEILHSNLTKEEAEQKEIEMIAFYDSTNSSKGYNCLKGGGITDNSNNVGNKPLNYYILEKQKRVCKYDLNGKFIEEFQSVSVACKKLGYNQNAKATISHICRHDVTQYGGKYLTYKGFQWRYWEETKGEDIAPILKKKTGIKPNKIIQIDEKGNFIKQWESSEQCDKILNTHSNSVCNKYAVSSKGKYFMYEKDYNDARKLKEYLIKISNLDKRISNSGVGISIVQIDESNNIIAQYESLGEASRKTQISEGAIKNCCKNKLTKGKKYIYPFRYANDI